MEPILSVRIDKFYCSCYYYISRMIPLSGGKLDNTVRFGNVFIPFRHSVKASSPENLIMQSLSRSERAPRRDPAIEGPQSKLTSLSLSVRTVEDIERMIDKVKLGILYLYKLHITISPVDRK